MFDNLFEFIMQNLFFLILVIGGIISFLQRLGGEKNQEKRPQRQRTNEPKVDWGEIFNQESKRRPPEQPKRDYPQTTYQVEVEVPGVPVNEKTEIADNELGQDSPIFANDITKKRTRMDLDFKKISSEEAMKGIIWSEILSKPKASRSPFNKNQYHKQ